MKDMEDISAKNIEFEALDKEFQELLKQIGGDESLEKYRFEYEKLYKTFRSSFENEKRLVKQSRDLNDMIVNNAANVKVALEMSQEDSNTIKRLRKEIEKAWQFVEKAKEKEERSKKMVQDLKEEIGHLNNIVGQGATLSLGPENNVDELLKAKENLAKQHEEKKVHITALEGEISTMKDAKSEQERKAVGLLADLKTLKEDADRCETDNKRKDDKIKHQEEQYKNITKDLEIKVQEKEKLEKELQSVVNECRTISEAIQKKTFELKESSDMWKNTVEQCDIIEGEKNTGTSELENLKALIKKAKSDIDGFKSEISMSESEKKKLEKEMDKLKLKQKKQSDKVKNLANDKTIAINTIQKLERDLERIQKEMENDRQLYRNLQDDNETVHTKVSGAEDKNSTFEEDLKSTEEEITSWKREQI